ncbi:cupin domain-containing protein [Bacillaceae bacterium SIJ1]|nr:cupin domain-containing protein [Litoribacterium kuwaitense]NGP46374.1 cupin domain-containing protein [Litoribacterium kuwaitense]
MMRKKTDYMRWTFGIDEHPQLQGVPELIMLGYDHLTEALQLSDHLHEQCFEFVYMERGQSSWEVDQHSYTSRTGQIFHTRPNEWHRARMNHIEPCTIWWLIMTDPSRFHQWLNIKGDEKIALQQALHQLPRIVSVDPSLSETFRKMRHSLEERHPLSEIYIRHSILTILFQLLQPSNSHDIPADLYEAMVELAEHIKKIPINDGQLKKLPKSSGLVSLTLIVYSVACTASLRQLLSTV